MFSDFLKLFYDSSPHINFKGSKGSTVYCFFCKCAVVYVGCFLYQTYESRNLRIPLDILPAGL